MQQDKEFFKQFVKFCGNQPEGNFIDHDMWRTCAVGDFHRYIGQEGYYINSFAEKLLGRGELFSKMNTSDCPNTYGEFTEFLKEYL